MSVYWFTGFESGDSSEITTLGSGQSIVAGGQSGGYVLQNDGSGATRSVTTVADKSRSFFSVAFNVASLTPTNGWTTDFGFFDSTPAQVMTLLVLYSGGTWQYYCQGGAGLPFDASGSNPPVVGWNLLECDFSKGSGTARVWLNGVEIINGAATFSSNTITSFRYGLVSGASATADNVLLIDDIILDDAARIGDGRVIARQIKSGSPTYDEFTKSSGTIDAVWSDTPFSAASYARSALAAARQTGLLSSFSTTQTGHGSGTVSASDTIEAIRAALVAKTVATTAAGITIVGTSQSGSSTAGGNITLTFSTAPQAGDVVIVCGGFGTAGANNPGITTPGYTQIFLDTGTAARRFGAWYKVMGDTPDTQVVGTGSGAAGDGVVYLSTVLRQAFNNTSPLDISVPSVATGSSTNPNPPTSGATATTNTLVISMAASAVNDASKGTQTNYTQRSDGTANATRPYSAAHSSRAIASSGTNEDPPAWSSWSTGAWVANTIVIRQATEAGSAASIRVRLASVDTDTAITLTTSDAYYDVVSGTVPTLSNLNASEVGLLHGSSSIQQQVEDVWIQIAYVAGEAGPGPLPPFPNPIRPSIVQAEFRRAFIPLLHSVKPPNRLDQWPILITPYRVYAEVRAAYRPLLHSVYPPINQEDWPLPKRPPIVYAQSYSSPYALTTVVTLPFSQTDWPPPKLVPHRFYAENESTNFQLLSSVYPPINQESWPLPIRPPIVYAQNYPSPYVLITVVTLPFFETDWPTPIQPPRVYAQNYPSPYALITTRPFVEADWPVPIPPPRVYAETRRANLDLLHSVYPPINQESWPPPILPYRVYAQSYSMAPTVLGVTPTPFVQEDWPAPIQPHRVYAEARRADIRLLHSVYPPIEQPDWPPPKLVPHRFYAQSATLFALHLEKPFDQSDWPAPIPPYRVYAEARAAFIPLLHSVAPPINQEEWPLPIRPPIVYARSYGTPATMFTAPIKPGHQDDWPLPKFTPHRFYAQSTTLFALHLEKPFEQSDWPAPIPPPRIYAETRRADIGLLHSIKPPISQSDWPLPKLIFTPTSARTWINQAIRVVQAPFVQSDWPAPILPVYPTSARTWIGNTLALITARPFAQTDWPQPIRPPVLPAKHFPYPNTVLAAAITKPFKQDTWPLPIRPPVPPSRHFRLENIVIAQALTKPFLQSDWPLPIPPMFPAWMRKSREGSFPTNVMITPPVPRVPTEGRFRSPLQADDSRPDVPDQRRPGQSDIRRPGNMSPTTSRVRPWRYD